MASLPPTFEQLKATIVGRVRTTEVCGNYPAMLAATNYAQLIAAAVGMFDWVYDNGIVTDADLGNFPISDLNAAGIYTGENSLTDPIGEMFYFIGPGTNSINLSGNTIFKSRFIGGNVTSVFLNDNAHITAESDSTLAISLTGVNTSGCIITTGQANTQIVNRGSLQARIGGNGVLSYSSSAGSTAIIRMANYSTYNFDDVQGYVNLSKDNTATINEQAT